MVERGRLDRHCHDVRGRDPIEQLVRRHRGQHADAPAEARVRSAPLKLGLEVAVAQQHENGVRDGRNGLDELLDAAVAREAALVQDDPGLGREAEHLVEPPRS